MQPPSAQPSSATTLSVAAGLEPSFVRVLHESDRDYFFAQITPADCDEDGVLRRMSLHRWLRIVANFPQVRSPAVCYHVYRRAWFGEVTGPRPLSARLTEYMIPMWWFTSVEREGDDLITQDLRRWWRYIWSGGRETWTNADQRILLSDQRMELVNHVSSHYRCSAAWRDYVMPDEVYT